MKKLLRLVSVAGLALALAACSGSGDDGATATAAPSPSAVPSSTAPSTPSPSPSSTPTPRSAGSSSATPTCATADLRVTVRRARGGGAAGSSYADVLLRNTGGATCAMTGWPGVSFVTGADGRQVGAAARREGSPGVVRLASGRSATARLQVASAANFQACRATDVRGYRVYPPNQRDAVFVASPGTACASTSAPQLTVQPVGP